MWFIGVEVEQETSAPPPEKNPGSAPVLVTTVIVVAFNDLISRLLTSLLVTGKVTFSGHVTLCKFNLCYK